MRNDLGNNSLRTHSHRSRLIALAALGVLFLPAYSAGPQILAQEPEKSEVSESPQNREKTQGRDLISPLNLTPEQREKIRTIREQTKDDRAAIGRRLRETNRALEDALDADSPDEAAVEQRLQDLAAAQTAQMRMRVMTEVRIRRVLTPEQQAVLHKMRIRAGELNRERPLMRRLRQREGKEQRPHRADERRDRDPLLHRPADKRPPNP
ncbi:MAG TPA: Spy/CpxP family protein refolding chaperone [Pyrinomonadaceae bacterium]|nr:Spy/CpxP family protein refolding chaperone [Pyrinomonadaceae bacterium]